MFISVSGNCNYISHPRRMQPVIIPLNLERIPVVQVRDLEGISPPWESS